MSALDGDGCFYSIADKMRLVNISKLSAADWRADKFNVISGQFELGVKFGLFERAAGSDLGVVVVDIVGHDGRVKRVDRGFEGRVIVGNFGELTAIGVH